MNIYIAKDSTIDLNISKIVQHVNATCDFVKFEELPLIFPPADKLVKFPETHNAYLQQINFKLEQDDLIVVMTQIQYDNNYFYNEKDGLIILSFFAWKYLTSLPVENGLIYFLCGILIDEVVPYNAVDHTERLGCVNDFLFDKTRVDDGMRKGFLCEHCRKYIQKHRLSETQSFLYNDVISMLKDLAMASGEEQSVISDKPGVTLNAANFRIKANTGPKNKTGGNSLFISYSHKDEKDRKKLEDHLKILQRIGLISTWTDRKITAGDEWRGQIDDNLKNARIILMLISSNFMASDYCYDIEMTTALKRHQNNEATAIPVILRDCLWQVAEFAKLQALPQDGKPIQSFARKDEAYTSIARAIARIIKGD